MAFSLVNGAAVKTVATVDQRDELIARGWELKDGSASTAPDLNNFTNQTPRDFKGIGFEGEPVGSIAYVAKKATEGATQEDYEGLKDVIQKYGSHIPDAETYTNGISIVSALPTSSQSATTIYLLKNKYVASKKTYEPGCYIYKGSAWVEYTL